MHLLVV